MDAVLDAWVPRGTIGGSLAKYEIVPAREFLVDKGAGPNGRTPLMLAVISGQAEVVRRLMGRWGAANLMGPTPVASGTWRGKGCILHLAVGVDEATRLQLVGMEAHHVTPLKLALRGPHRANLDLVKALANPKWVHGAVLPPAFCSMVGDSVFSLESYIDGTWDKHVALNERFRHSLHTAKWNSELRGSMPSFELPFISSQIEFTPAAQIRHVTFPHLSRTHIKHRVDMSLAQLMVQFNAEITGVMELLDIQSLGRVQQTSRFWYQSGRTNDLWRRALFNSSRQWSQRVRHKVDKCLESLPVATTKVYRNCDEVITNATSVLGCRPVHRPLNVRFFSGVTLLYDILQT
ncbi:hypothetical protein Pelo_17270 [Pelomyxa schiedti]|nr:hypothetical protein Pelo_17270 [Pelomyxa schiedti]